MATRSLKTLLRGQSALRGRSKLQLEVSSEEEKMHPKWLAWSAALGEVVAFKPEFFMPCCSLACVHVFHISWWFMFFTCHGGSCLLHVMVVHVFYMSWWFMSFTCHGASWLLTCHGVFRMSDILVHVFSKSWWSMFFDMSWWFKFLSCHAGLYFLHVMLFFRYIYMNSCQEASYFHVFYSTQGRR